MKTCRLTSPQVRCTGEVNGCQRCQRGNKFCHYSESNMGRTMDGTQRRRRSALKSSGSTTSHGDLDEFDWISSSSTSTNTNLTDQFPNAMLTPDLDRLAANSINVWEECRSLRQQDSDQAVHSRESSRPAYSSLIADLDDMDFEGIHGPLLDGDSPLDVDFPQLVRSPSSQPPAQHQRRSQASTDTRPSTPSRADSTGGKRVDETNSMPDVNSWTHLLGKLSRSGQSTPVALDELLHHSSALVPRATQALQSIPSDPSCMTSLLMILLCVTQTIALFEQCIPSVIRGLASSGSKDISLRLGAYQVDREAQQALQRHIVTKELSRIHHVAKLAKQALQQPGLAGVSKRTHSLLLDDLQARVKSLAYLVKEKWGSATQLVF